MGKYLTDFKILDDTYDEVDTNGICVSVCPYQLTLEHIPVQKMIDSFITENLQFFQFSIKNVVYIIWK